MLYATTAHTHLDAIRRNLEGVRARVGDREVLVAVKADAYGHGAVAVARMVERTRCADRLGVATMPEALALRDAGVRLPILKLSHALSGDEIEAALAADVTLTVVDAAGADAVGAAASRLGRTASVHVKVDTGMRRIGAEPADAAALARRVDASGLRLEGIFSHLAVSDTTDPAAWEFTAVQVARFEAAVAAVEGARGRVPLRHLSASAGVLAHPEAWFDLVRPGIMAYGSLPDPACPATVSLAPALTWTTRVSFVKRVAAGESVGYGRTWVAPRDTWIATLPVGYADGYSRLLSNRGRVLIGGRSFRVVGRVCMDQVMVDVGDADAARSDAGRSDAARSDAARSDAGDSDAGWSDAGRSGAGWSGAVTVGDEAVLLGRSGAEEITVAELAEAMGTIPYEVTCLIGPRVIRTSGTTETGTSVE